MDGNRGYEVLGYAERIVVLAALICAVAWQAPNVALGLSGGRVIELVSPTYKGGFGASSIEAVAQDGESVAFFSPGVFANAPSGLSGGLNNLPAYLARRSSSGWSTVAFVPPAELVPLVPARDVSPMLDLTFAFGYAAANVETGHQQELQGNFLLHQADAPENLEGWTLLGPPVESLTKDNVPIAYKGASDDFCHVFFENVGSSVHPFTPKEVGTNSRIYEKPGGCHGESLGLKLVGVNNEENVINKVCVVDIGDQDYGDDAQASFNAVSADGQEVFFTTCINDETSHYQLFVRLDATRTVEVSKPIDEETTCAEQIPCPEAIKRASAQFQGAAEDASQAFFTTSAPLTGDTEDSSNNLFVARIGCPESESTCSVSERKVTALIQASHNPNSGKSAGVRGVVRVARDGSRAYFVASGDLLDSSEQQALEAEGLPVPMTGADNLYLYDATSGGKVIFIGDLCSGYELSGLGSTAFEDPRCLSHTGADQGLWKGSSAEAQSGGSDGRFLVFSTYAQLVKDDTDTARDIYRYDAVTGILSRVSAGENGADSDGNNSEFDASIMSGNRLTYSVRNQHEMSSQAVSEDGSRIVFRSAEPLSHQASNGLPNVYEWHGSLERKGEVALVSSGTADTPTEDVVISPGGDDIFFDTTQGLVKEDMDGEPDVYDARVKGGFSASGSPVAECEGEACRGALSRPASLLVPGSLVQAPGGNFSNPRPHPKVKPKSKKPKKKVRKTTKKRKGGHSSSGRKSQRSARVGKASRGGTL